MLGHSSSEHRSPGEASAGSAGRVGAPAVGNPHGGASGLFSVQQEAAGNLRGVPGSGLVV